MSAKNKHGFTINIFLPDGEPEGIKIVEKSIGASHGIVCPRSLFQEGKKREEFKKTGVYILTGYSEDSDEIKVYIGEGDPILDRLNQHYAKKDFWTTAIAFTSKDAHLNKAHVQFLESRLVELAKEAKQCELDNGNIPARPSLSEMEESFAEGFLEEMLLCFPILGVKIFEQPSRPSKTSKMQFYHIKMKGIKARGYESGDGFVVCKDSQAVMEVTQSCPDYVKDHRKKLLKQKVLIKEDKALVFTLDFNFPSPSGASSVINGGTSNGVTTWKTENGRTLKEVRESEAT